ncbi:MAG: molybdopterin converting factor subunit 1 [Rhizobiales bacterium]|nr:molybdopterin converting factor subunit 1 [Hyphomicrobiales bacterium]
MKLLYFAWVRQRTGIGEETVDLPEAVTTVNELMGWLSARDEGYESAFANPKLIRAAIDQQHVDLEAPIGGAREIAFFPPVTGG